MYHSKSRRKGSVLFIILLCMPSIIMCAGNEDDNKVPFYQDPTVISLSLGAVTALAAFGKAFCDYRATKHAAHVSQQESKLKLLDSLRAIERQCDDQERRIQIQGRIDQLTQTLTEQLKAAA